MAIAWRTRRGSTVDAILEQVGRICLGPRTAASPESEIRTASAMVAAPVSGSLSHLASAVLLRAFDKAPQEDQICMENTKRHGIAMVIRLC